MSTNLDPRNVTVGESAPAEPRTEAQITADLERQRAELAATIDQLYARVQPATLAQEAKEEATVRFKSFKETASLTLQDAVGGNAEAIKKVAIVALSTVGALTVIVLLATRKSRRARRQARRIGREAAAQTLAALAAADQLAHRPEFAGKTIVTLLPDTGERYLSTPLYSAYLD